MDSIVKHAWMTETITRRIACEAEKKWPDLPLTEARFGSQVVV